MKFADTQQREIFHFLFLEQLVRITDPKLYVLKGGVNLRFFFNSPRYSEDMDLDVLAGNVSTLKKNGYKVLDSSSFKRSLRTFGITDLQLSDPLKAKHTETTQRFQLRLLTEAGEQLPTKVEFSRRQNEKLPTTVAQVSPDIARSYQRLAFPCQHYTGESAAAQKIGALAGRKLTQARDVFDLGILNSGGYLKSETVKKQVNRSILRAARESLNSITYSQFQGQVLAFLEIEIRVAYEGKDGWEKLKASVMEILSGGE